MPRLCLAVLTLLCLLALPLGLAHPPPAAAASPFRFAPPESMSTGQGGHPAVLAALPGGAVAAAFFSLDSTTLFVAENATPGGAFAVTPLDSSPARVGNPRLIHDNHGRLHLIWYHGQPDGSGQVVVEYARRDPAVPGSTWQVGVLPGSETGPATGGGYKVLGLAHDGADRLYALWSRNQGGARLAWTDDGTRWSPVEILPGPLRPSAGDFTLGVTTGGVLFVAWFDRESGDIQVQMRPPGGAWADPVDVSARPGKGQDYAPRLAADPAGGMRLAWTGYADAGNTQTDGFYREWTPAAGWIPDIVPLFQTPGKGNTVGLQIAVDSAGVNHVVWDDDTGRTPGLVTTYYIRGTRGGFSAPQPLFLDFGDATTRLPFVAVGPGLHGTDVVHLVANSDVRPVATGAFDNYYTWTDAGVPPPAPAPPPAPQNVHPGHYGPGLPLTICWL